MTMPFTMTLDAPGLQDGALQLVSLRGREAISELFEFELLLKNDGLDEPLGYGEITQLLGSRLTAEFNEAGGALCGIIREVELLPAVDLENSHYRVVLVPRLWLATQTLRSSIYQEMAIPEIIVMVLERLGIEHTIALSETYQPLEYVVQYEESDFNFISRLMEDGGIFFRFEHDPGGGDRLFIHDRSTSLDMGADFSSMPYIPKGMEPPLGGALTAISCRQRLLPTSMTVRAYNYRVPPYYVEGQSEISSRLPETPLVDYGQHVKSEAEAAARATIRGEALTAQGIRFYGRSSCAWLRTGGRVEIDDHSDNGIHPDYPQELLITEVVHDWDENWLYKNEFVALAATTPYRPPLRAIRPRVDGVIHGRIIGEMSGSKAPNIDEQGRYLVQYLFGNSGESVAQVSRWTRMAQPHAGASGDGNYGLHFPLHAGTEVIIAHIRGDPDRPLIVGAVPNPLTESPVTSLNPFHNVLRTRSGIVMSFVDEE